MGTARQAGSYTGQGGYRSKAGLAMQLGSHRVQVRQAQGSQSVTATQTYTEGQARMHAVQCGQGKEGILADSAREAGMARQLK